MLKSRYFQTIGFVACVFVALATSSIAQEKVQVGTPPAMKPDVVGAGGEYTQSVAFDLPKFRGLVPNIRLSYNSSNTSRGGIDNTVAFGWRLSGLSAIERVSLGGGVPMFDDGQDIYRIDGSGLMACNDAAATNKWTRRYPLRFLTDQTSASCASGGNLTARIEDYQKVVFTEATNEFLVTEPDGTKRRYRSIGMLAGDTSVPASGDSYRLAFQRRWLVTDITDTNGNTVTITYEFGTAADGYSERPTRIDYAGYSTNFYYTAAVAPFAQFGTGTDTLGTQRYVLSAVTTMDGAAPIKAWQLLRSTSQISKALLLTGVDFYGSNFVRNGAIISSGSKLPGQQFTYSPDTYSTTLYSYPGVEFQRNYAVVDWDYTGVDNILMLGGFDWYIRQNADHDRFLEVRRNLPTARYIVNRSNRSTLIPQPAVIPTGCDNAGRTEVYEEFYDGKCAASPTLSLTGNDRGNSPQVGLTANTTYRESSGSGPTGGNPHYQTTRYTHRLGPTTPTIQSSMVGSDLSGYYYKPGLRGNFDLDADTEILGANPTYGSATGIADGIFIAENWSGITAFSANANANFVFDLDGDGVDDIVSPTYFGITPSNFGSLQTVTIARTRPEYGYQAGSLQQRGPGVSKALGTNKSFSPFYSQTGANQISFAGYGDINGDSLPDIVFYDRRGSANDVVSAFLSTGFGFTTKLDFLTNANYGSGLIGEFNVTIRDVNSDGLSDLFINILTPYVQNLFFPSGGGRQATLLLNSGTDFLQQTIAPAGTEFDKFLTVGDFDGDGLVDYLRGSGVVGFNQSLQPGQIFFTSSAPPNRLVSATSPLGGTTNVAYRPSTYDQNGAFVGSNQMPGVQNVVDKITTVDGRGASSQISYNYVGGAYDFINRQTLGYRTVTAYLPPIAGEISAPAVTTTYLNDNIAENGLMKSRIVSTAGTTTWQKKVNNWSVIFVGNGPYKAQKIGERQTSLFDTNLIETTTTTAYNSYGQPVVKSSLGFTLNGINIDPSDDVTISYGYNPNVASYIVDEPKFEQTERGLLATSSKSNWLSFYTYSYDDALNYDTGIPTRGNVTAVKQWTGDLNSLVLRDEQTLTYDLSGNLLTETDARGYTSTHTYDPSKALFRTSTSNALSHLTTMVWNTACQSPTSQVDPNGLTRIFEYDIFCRETRQSYPNGNYLISRYQNFGDPAAQYKEQESKSASTAVGQTLAISRSYFDGIGQIYKTVSPGTTSAIDQSIVQLRSYDQRGNLSWQSNPLSWTAASTNTASASETTKFGYDPVNRPLVTTLPDGSLQSTTYVALSFSQDGAPAMLYPGVRSSDAHCFDLLSENTICGEIWQFFDASQRQIRLQQADTALSDTDAVGNSQRITDYQFDLKGQLIKVSDPAAKIWTYAYDIFGNRVTSSDPDLGLWTLAYDANGNLTQQTDAKGQQITFTYDALNRPTQKIVLGGSDGSKTTNYTYDQARAGYFNKGQLTRQSRGTHKIETDYDNTGQAVRDIHTVTLAGPARAYNIEKSFAPNGQLLNQRLPNTPGDILNAWVGSYGFDAASRVTSLSKTGVPTSPYIASITYNLRSQPVEMRFGNGANNRIDYNPARGWIDRIESRETSLTTLPFLTSTYNRTATGRIKRADTEMTEGDFDYTYDYAGRLLNAANFSAQSSFNQTFTYDKAGRMTANSRVGTYDYLPTGPQHAPGRIIASGAPVTLTYDANGNMKTGLDGKIMTYDGENRPLSVTYLGKTTSYTYGADGSRFTKTENAGTALAKTTVYFGPVEVRNYGQGIAEQVITYPDPNLRLVNGVANYLHRDQLSSVRGTTGADGLKDDRAVYRPFGEQTEFVFDAAAAAESKGFIGERYDADAGLQYLNARYYDPKLGIFLQPDWFEVTKAGVGTNRYGYSGGDPVNGKDPGGNDAYKQKLAKDYLRKEANNAAEALSEVEEKTARAGVGLLAGAAILAAPEVEAGELVLGLASKYPQLYSFGMDVATSEATGMTVARTGVVAIGGKVVTEGAELVADAAKVHKNSLSYVGETHVYAIKGETGAFKIGESAQGTRLVGGASIRAEQQVGKILRETGRVLQSEIRQTFDSKAAARAYERRFIETYRRLFGVDGLPGNKTNR